MKTRTFPEILKIKIINFLRCQEFMRKSRSSLLFSKKREIFLSSIPTLGQHIEKFTSREKLIEKVISYERV